MTTTRGLQRHDPRHQAETGRDPAFFRGETLVKDTPALVVED